MTVTRINEFQAKEGKGGDLLELIGSFVPAIKASDGCLSCRLLQSRADPARIVVIEVWESAEAHEASMKNIPPQAMEKAMQLLASPPEGEYYSG